MWCDNLGLDVALCRTVSKGWGRGMPVALFAYGARAYQTASDQNKTPGIWRSFPQAAAFLGKSELRIAAGKFSAEQNKRLKQNPIMRNLPCHGFVEPVNDGANIWRTGQQGVTLFNPRGFYMGDSVGRYDIPARPHVRRIAGEMTLGDPTVRDIFVVLFCVPPWLCGRPNAASHKGRATFLGAPDRNGVASNRQAERRTASGNRLTVNACPAGEGTWKGEHPLAVAFARAAHAFIKGAVPSAQNHAGWHNARYTLKCGSG